MNEMVPNGKQILKRPRMNRRAPVADPLDLFYASVGYLGVFYESQLVYFKHELDAKEASASSDNLIQSLQAMQTFVLNLISRNAVGVPLNQSVREFLDANRQAVQQLAIEGKALVQQIEQERRKL
jgi:hypothetical protein